MEVYRGFGHRKEGVTYLWWWSSGKLHDKKMENDEGHRELDKKRVMDITRTDYTGRYDSNLKVITLTCVNPRLIQRDVPENIIDSLENRFPEAEELRILKKKI